MSFSNSIVRYSLLSFPLASCGLGYWQLKRLDWKLGLIADLEARQRDEPIDLLKIESAKQLESLEYARAKVKGTFDQNPSHQIYLKPRPLVANDEAISRGRTALQSNIGVNVVTPFLVDGTNLRILVNRGWLPIRGPDSVDNLAKLGMGKEGEKMEVVGVIRKSDNRPRYGQKNNVSSNEWQVRDIPAMAKVLHTAPIFIDADQNLSKGEGPIGGQTQLNVRNEHLNYAITWFLLALCTALMWYKAYGGRGMKRKLLRH